MIIYGTKSKVLATGPLAATCPNCGTQNSMNLSVVQKYLHVFWLPFCPLGKTGITQCSHCKQVLRKNEMPAALQAGYNEAAAKTKTPIYTFAGLAVLVVLIVFVALTSK